MYKLNKFMFFLKCENSLWKLLPWNNWKNGSFQLTLPLYYFATVDLAVLKQYTTHTVLEHFSSDRYLQPFPYV